MSIWSWIGIALACIALVAIIMVVIWLGRRYGWPGFGGGGGGGGNTPILRIAIAIVGSTIILGVAWYIGHWDTIYRVEKLVKEQVKDDHEFHDKVYNDMFLREHEREEHFYGQDKDALLVKIKPWTEEERRRMEDPPATGPSTTRMSGPRPTTAKTHITGGFTVSGVLYFDDGQPQAYSNSCVKCHGNHHR